MAKRLANGRRQELLDGVMRIIAARGFSEVKISEMARELHCSGESLYKIAPSKDSLVLMAIGRWAEITLPAMDARAAKGETAADRAREYFRAGATALHPLSPAFREDSQRFESTRLLWVTAVTEPFIARFVELLGLAIEAGEVLPLNTGFLGEVIRRIAWVVRDEQVLQANGMTAEEGLLVVDEMIWNGILERPPCEPEAS